MLRWRPKKQAIVRYTKKKTEIKQNKKKTKTKQNALRKHDRSMRRRSVRNQVRSRIDRLIINHGAFCFF